MAQPQASLKVPSLRFYDIATKIDPRSYSSNTLKTLLALHIRQLPYERIALSYPDIAPTLKELGVPPASSSPPYTLPALRIGDDVPIMGSKEIAVELDKLIPASSDHPALFPSDEAFEWAEQIDKARSSTGSLWNYILPYHPEILDERGSKYFVETRSDKYGSLSEMRSKEKLGEFEEALGKAVLPIAKALKERQERMGGGPFGLGDKPTYGDVMVIAALESVRIVRGAEVLQRVLVRTEGGVLAKLFQASEGLLQPRAEA